MPAAAGIQVEGLRELRRGLRGVSTDVSRRLTRELREIGEDVRVLAERKASSEIPHIGAGWERMRVGVTASVVYIAPRAHRQGGSPRPRFGGLLVTRSLVPAVEESQPRTVLKVEGLLDSIVSSNGFFS